MDFFGELPRFEGRVLFLHGDADTTVDVSISKRGAELIPGSRFHCVRGGSHGFRNGQFEDAVCCVLEFLQSV